jgi:hypothetical protein
VEFYLEYPVLIGNPPKKHKFDLVSADFRYIGECKNYSWTETGNVPSAKMTCLNEAVFYLQHVSHDTHRFVVLRRDTCVKRTESLGEYYFRMNQHLLNGVLVLELDVEAQSLCEIG